MRHMTSNDISEVVVALIKYAERIGDTISNHEGLWIHQLTNSDSGDTEWWIACNPQDETLTANHPELGEFRIQPSHFVVFKNKSPCATFTLLGGRVLIPTIRTLSMNYSDYFQLCLRADFR